MDLNELLTAYKNITLDMIEKVENNLEISSLIKDREKLLINLSELNADKLKVKAEVESLEIIKYEQKLQSIVQMKMLETRKNINRLKQSQVAYNQYVNFKGNAMIFSTTR